MRVLISGAGIAGPTLAYHLSKAINTQVTIVEKSSELLAQGQNIDVHGTALKILQKMGLYEKLKNLNSSEIGTRFIGENGKVYAEFPIKIEGIKGKCGSPTSEYEIIRGDLAKMLYESTLKDENIKYLLGTTVKKVLENDKDFIKVLLSDGTIEQFDLLVAADGQWSKIRKDNFTMENVKIIDKNNYLIYWTTTKLSQDDHWWNIYHSTRSRILSLRPDPHGTIRSVLGLMPNNKEQKIKLEKASRSNNKEFRMKVIREEFHDAGWQAKRLLDSMENSNDFYFQALKQIKMKHWSNGRIICLGDAAYAPTPLTGYGTPLAIVGAYVLAGELSLLEKGENPIKALKEYENIYKPFVEKIQKVSFYFPRIIYPFSSFNLYFVRLGLWIMSKFYSSSWFVKHYGQYEEKEDFHLKYYPKLEKIAVN